MLGWLRSKKKETNVENNIPSKEYVFNEVEAKEILFEIKQRYGLDYSKQEFITMKKIERFARLNNLFSFRELRENIKKDSSLYEKLINMLTVGETYFYREVTQIEYLAKVFQEQNSIKILSAPCSSGEEVYSILLYFQSKNLLNHSISIKGIDINSDALQKAQLGLYNERSTSQLPLELRQKYFSKEDNYYKIDEQLKRFVTFERANVFELNENGEKFDVILSRNMLIYFDEREKKKVIQKFHTLLKYGGLLCLGHADISFMPEGFIKENTTSNIYKKV